MSLARFESDDGDDAIVTLDYRAHLRKVPRLGEEEVGERKDDPRVSYRGGCGSLVHYAAFEDARSGGKEEVRDR